MNRDNWPKPQPYSDWLEAAPPEWWDDVKNERRNYLTTLVPNERRAFIQDLIDKKYNKVHHIDYQDIYI